jgi:hypothetical protein
VVLDLLEHGFDAVELRVARQQVVQEDAELRHFGPSCLQDFASVDADVVQHHHTRHVHPAAEATGAAEREQGGLFLDAASAAGVGPVPFNLAGTVVMGYGGGSCEERKERAAELHSQEFTAFEWHMHGEGP